jgi:hypothetical protein
MQKQMRRSWRSVFGVVLILGLSAWSTAWADDPSESGVKPQAALQSVLEEMGITFSGAVEIEAGYEDMDFDDPAGADKITSDLALATVELGVDARINPYLLAHVLFLYEEEPDADIEVDEGFIQLGGDDVSPFYALFGRLYAPFGYYESHFISDPMTVDLGETREAAGVLGYTNDRVDVFFGLFNGDVDETGDDDDHLENFFGGITVTLPEKDWAAVVIGASFISNIADSDTLADEISTADKTVADPVFGYSIFASAAFSDRFFFEAEIMGAGDEFKAGELAFDTGNAYQPRVINIEFALMVNKCMELGVRYGTAEDGGDFLPESLLGGVINYAVFENTSVGLEVQTGKFENDDRITTCTGQLAVAF